MGQGWAGSLQVRIFHQRLVTQRPPEVTHTVRVGAYSHHCTAATPIKCLWFSKAQSLEDPARALG